VVYTPNIVFVRAIHKTSAGSKIPCDKYPLELIRCCCVVAMLLIASNIDSKNPLLPRMQQRCLWNLGEGRHNLFLCLMVLVSTIITSKLLLQGETNEAVARAGSVATEYATTADIKTIALLGERNSGTTWMLKELRRCYGQKIVVLNRLTRHKHYFQLDDGKKHNQTLVIAEFRDPYQYILAMVDKPRRTTDHRQMDWKTFVETPWTTERAASDLKYANSTGRVCQEKFTYNEVIPCERNPEENEYLTQKRAGKELVQSIPIYELKRDGSGEPYDSIVDLRADKIRNHVLEVKEFPFVNDVVVVRYEDLLKFGTGPLHKEIFASAGIEPHCDPTPPQPNRAPRPVGDDFKQWMDEHVDWEAEALIGYEPY